MGLLDDLAKRLDSTAKLEAIGQFAVSAIQKKIAGGRFTPNSPITSNVKKGSPPLSDRGGLIGSVHHNVSPDTVSIATNHPGAAVNNYGGTIKAKGQWLVIPVSSKTRTLQRRYGWSAKEVCDGLRSDGFSVYRAGRAIFYRVKGPGSSKKKAVMIFILKKSVTIPKREFMRLTSDEVDALFEIIRS